MYKIRESNKIKYEGKVFDTENYGKLIIVEYRKNTDVFVRFLNTNYETTSELGNILKGKVKDRSSTTIFGVGHIGENKVTKNSKLIREYQIWYGMLKRCYSARKEHKYLSYKDCTVSENFLTFNYFKEWCNNQIGYDQDGWHLDKDILIKGNKVYSEDTCCFVPSEVNTLILKREKCRGKYPVGVSFYKPLNKYVAKMSIEGKTNSLGYFISAEDAFLVYKQAKEDYIKEIANKWKEQIDPRVYEALMNYQVEITD